MEKISEVLWKISIMLEILVHVCMDEGLGFSSISEHMRSEVVHVRDW